MLSARRPFFYRRLASPLHATRAGVGALWALTLTLGALLIFQPLVLLALTLAVLAAGALAGVGPQLARTLRTAAIVAVAIVAINVLVSRDGLTVFARLGDLGPFGQGYLTVEAAVYGAVIALKVTLLMLATTLASLSVDPDELLGTLRRLSFRSALTASLATRMLPLLAADAERLAEARRTRPDGGGQGARARVALVGAVIGGSLDRAMDVAATLELRGFGAARPAKAARGRRPRVRGRRARGSGGAVRTGPLTWSRHDIAFAASALAVLALCVLARLSHLAPFRAYPLVHAPMGAGALVLCLALVAVVLAPFCDRRGIEP
ncbi:MAG TPA: energy-coupling factor transporter transmembrane component T [Solirubrobacteraceae bacterium]|nr:energy-coupling factor transporter transmembrane component T [Solirubrobacteraceae bacterium]